MADFDFEPLELFKTVQKEGQEANVAEENFVSVVDTESRKQLTDIERLNADIAAVARDQAESHAGIIQHIDTANEMQGNFLNNLIASSELAKFFPMATPQGQLDAAAKIGTKVKLRQDELALRMRQFNLTRQASIQKIQAAEANTNAELRDETRAQRALNNARALRDDQFIQQERLLASTTNLESLRGQVPDRFISEEQQRREAEQDAITMRKLTLRSSAMADIAGRVRVADKPGTVSGATVAQAEEEKRRRKSGEASLIQQEGQVRLTQNAEQDAIKRREGVGMTIRTIQGLLNSAKDKGQAVSSNGMIWQTSELTALLEQKQQFRRGVVDASIALEIGTQSITQRAVGIARGQGMAIDIRNQPDVYMEALVQDNTLDPDTRTAIATGNAFWREAQDTTQSLIERGEAMKQADAQYTQADKIYKTKRTALLATAHKMAATEWLDVGFVDSLESGLNSTVLAAQNGESSGSDVYDAGLASLSSLVTEIGRLDTEAGKAITRLTGEGDFGQAFKAVLSSSSGRKAVAKTIWEAGASDLYKLASTEMEDDEFMKLMNDKTGEFYRPSSEGTTFVVNTMKRYLRENKKIEAFENAVLKVLDDYTEKTFKSSGRRGFIAASLDRVVFDNQTNEFFKNQVRSDLARVSIVPTSPQAVAGFEQVTPDITTQGLPGQLPFGPLF